MLSRRQNRKQYVSKRQRKKERSKANQKLIYKIPKDVRKTNS